MTRLTLRQPSRGTVGCSFALALVAGTLILPLGASGADRMVLCEEFGRTTCYYCQFAGGALDLLVDEYPDTLAVVQIHTSGAPAIPWGTARASYYGVAGTPTVWFDGVLEVVGAGSVSSAYTTYRNRILSRAAIDTDITIEVFGTEITGSMYELTARVCMEADGTEREMRVQIVQVLDHWPIPPEYSRNTLMQAAAAADITVAPGECVDVVRSMNFDSTSWSQREDIKVIAWAQLISGSAPAEVYQAGKAYWPLTPVEPPTCDDGIRNQGEDRIDCGGPCPPCDCTADLYCNDGVYCTGEEWCDDYGHCQDGDPIDCDDGFDCTIDSCNEEGLRCDHDPVDELCDNGLFCDGVETCRAAQGCVPGTPPCDDMISCTINHCNEETDSCEYIPDDGFCDDEVFCNGEEVCNPTAGCQAGDAVVCDDGIDCTTDLCYEAMGQCLYLPVDAVCDDGFFCTGAETCNPEVGCISSGDPCGVDAWCDEDTESCVPYLYGNGDMDSDGDVDLADGGLFTRCFGQPSGGCEPGDMTGDGTVGMDDFVMFAEALEASGPR